MKKEKEVERKEREAERKEKEAERKERKAEQKEKIFLAEEQLEQKIVRQKEEAAIKVSV